MANQSLLGNEERFSKEWLEACSDAEFDSSMEEIDGELQRDKVPIFARQLRGVEYLCRRGGFSLILDEPLARRMSEWFVRRFGDRLKYDLSLGYGPVLVRGDLYRLRVPWLVFGGRIVCTMGPQPSGPLPVVNVLDFIEGLTEERKMALVAEELSAMRASFLRLTEGYLSLSEVRSAEGYKAALGDLQVASDCLFHARPLLGNSRWHSLQAVEKFIKAWLADKNVGFPFTHDLVRLAEIAESAGLPSLSRQDVSDVQCAPAVRYDDSLCGFSDCVRGYEAALRLCAAVADSVKAARPARVRTETLPGTPLTLPEFRSLSVGDRLVTFGRMELQIVGVQQDRPRWYLTLVRGATKRTMILEEDHASFARKP